MQEWGIYYFFEHKDGKHKLILVDAAGAHQPNPSSAYHKVAFYPPGHKIDEEYLNEIDFTESLASGVWVTNEFDFKKPKMDLKAKTKLPRNTAHNSLEMYSWPSDSHNPESPTSTDEAKHLTRIKLEQAGSLGQRASAKGNLRGMVVGSTFTLAEYLNSQYNDKDYLIIANHFSLTDVGASSGQERYKCECELEIQPANHIYRAPFNTPLPKTSGPQTAIITGPQGREIYTDQYGRVKLSFLWHRYCTKDENSSCWIRVNYPWAGNGFGGINIPRIGQEVIVDFENGDPDRPIVTGRVYNALNMPPWDLPANATQSGMLSRSSEGAGSANANAIRMEDMKGSEEIWIHAEKDQRIEVEHCESHSVGVDRSKTIGNDETVSVGHDRKENVGNDETIGIGHDRKETVGNNETISIGNDRKEDVGNNETISIGSNQTQSIGSNQTEDIGSNQTVTIGKTRTETIGMAHMQNIGLGKMVNVGAAYNINVGGIMATMVGMNKSTTVGASRSDSTSNDHEVQVGKNYQLVAGDSIELVCGKSTLRMDKEGNITINGHEFSLGTTGDQRLKASGANIILNADKILVMDKGRVINSGKHGELITQSIVYQEFIRELSHS